MTASHVQFPIRGIIPPLLTPLKDAATLDLPALERLVEHVIAGGVHGIFIMGTTGEFTCLSYTMRRELIAAASRIIRGRVPMLVNITDPCMEHSMEVAGWAVDAGAAALVLSPPYYYPITQVELQAYIAHLAPRLPLPVYLYNMPSHTKVAIEPPTVRAAMELPNVVGMKDSSGLMGYFHQVLVMMRDRRPDWTLLVGPEQLLAESTLIGGHGAVCGGSNLAPRLFVDLYDAAAAGNLPRVMELQQRVMQLSNTIYAVENKPSAFISGLKTALSVLGICDDVMGPPHQRYGPAHRQIIERHVKELNLAGYLAAGVAR